MAFTPRSELRQALDLLQALCLARIQLDCCRMRPAGSIEAELREFELTQRVIQREREAARMQSALGAGQRSALRVARALYLRLLLDSAARRLDGWSDQDPLQTMPDSRLFEWVAHDYERLELIQLESAMTPDEMQRYGEISGSLADGDEGGGVGSGDRR